MAVPLLAAVGGKVLGGIGSAILGGSAARRARRRQQQLEQQIQQLEGSRQQIIDPFASAASMLSNPYANLTVATQAAEMQAEQTDISLASTLDTLRATGMGSGGATALAQAALKAKQGVTASIAQQEARNEQLRAQGEARLQTQLFQAESMGKQFVFKQTEAREMQKLNRLSALAGNASQQAAAAQTTMIGGLGSILGGVGSAVGAGLTGDGTFFENISNAELPSTTTAV